RGMTSPDDAMTLRNNNRSYYSQGIQGVFDTNFELGEGLTQLEFGFRVHEDEEDRFQDEDGYRMDNGRLVLTTDNPGGSQSNRVSDADAWAVYAKADFELGDWHLIPGVRYENIDLVRRDYSTSDPGRLLGPTAVRGNHVTATIPGIGATYDLGSSWQLVGGIHKGFNPPGPGSSASEEESTNTEFGVRYSQGQIYVESMLFHNDYQNLVGTCTASTGGNCMVGDQFDGGEVLVAGLELTADYNLPSVFGNIGVPLELTYTYTPTAEFQNSFASGFDPWGDVMAGDRMPYMPENQLQFITGLAADRWGLYLNTLYVDEMRSESGQGSIPADVLIPSHTVTDLVGSYSFGQHTELMWRVDNLLDREYIVSRRPAGLRPGKPRTAMIGVQFSF
ncbi:MAG: TonB-dependent receptor, partial [Gammaproteobacteria bacterium]